MNWARGWCPPLDVVDKTGRIIADLDIRKLRLSFRIIRWPFKAGEVPQINRVYLSLRLHLRISAVA
jgi:hypothetical protein